MEDPWALPQCEWRMVDPWHYDPRRPMCRDHADFCVIRANESDLYVCGEHLTAFLFMYGVRRVRSAHPKRAIAIGGYDHEPGTRIVAGIDGRGIDRRS